MEVRLINANDVVKVAERAYDAWNLAMATQDTNRGVNKVFKMQELCKAVEAVAKDAPTIDPEDLPLVKELREQLAKVAVEEVAPVVHSEWVKKNENPLDGNYYCKHCGNGIDIADGSETPIDRGLFFCFNCGAKMKNK